MIVETVLGEAGMIFPHNPVPRDFCNDRGGGDGGAFCIAFYDGNLSRFDIRNGECIYKEYFGAGPKTGDSFTHRLFRSVEYVDPIDLVNVDYSNTDSA